MKLKNKETIFFNGDSITDAGRDRQDKYSLAGYSKIIAKTLKVIKPKASIKCYNRGVSGDTTKMLLERLEGELANIKPTIFSMLIGINDVWRRYDSNRPTSVEQFEENYSKILEIVSQYTNRIILLEPFLLTTDYEKNKFREDLDPKMAVVRKYAIKYKTDYIPLDGIFVELSTQYLPEIYSLDGVHPTPAGEQVIATEWLKRVL